MDYQVVLIDGSSYFFRAFHALPPLVSSKGQPTGAIYGVINMLKRLLKDYSPKYVAIVFDSTGKTFRDELFAAYKANRPPMAQDLSIQFAPLIKCIQAMGIPTIIQEGVEADDVIGTIAKDAARQGLNVLISTSDKDLAQLVETNITLVNTMSEQILDIEGVKQKFGVSPDQMIDYLTLVGDTTDNIPGVPQCGPKTAAKWLQTYNSLDNLVEHATEISGKIGEKLRASIANFDLTKKLITIHTTLSLPVTLHDLTQQPADREQLIVLTRELEFKNWLQELLATTASTTSEVRCELISDSTQLKAWLAKQNISQEFCMHTDPEGIAIVTDSHPAYISINNPSLLQDIKFLLEDPNIKKIGQNLKLDYLALKKHNITLRGIAFDTMLESYVLNSTAARHDLESLALKYLGTQSISTSPANHAETACKLHTTLYPKLDPRLKTVFHDIEIPLITVLADMEARGVLIDCAILSTQGERLRKALQALAEEVTSLAGKDFNINSPKQLQEVLYDELKLPILAKTPTGQPSTAEAVLQELAFEYRLPAAILEYRSISKLISTYIDVLPKRIDAANRVHTSYNQATTSTGRLSSSDPNLQNIPTKNVEGRMIRQAFIAPPNYKILAADYSQIELRIMAHLSQDPTLVNAFAIGADIHAATASELFGVALQDVTHAQRRYAKIVNFGLIYGMSSFGLAKQLGVGREEAQSYIDQYFRRYPGVLAYMENTCATARQQGYVETIYGRRLYLPEINSPNKMRRKAAERTAINAPMQGTAADIIKRAMIDIAAWQQQQLTPNTYMIMQVHDELVFEIHEDFIESHKNTIKNIMENATTLSVPLLVSIGIGYNWDEAH